MEARKQLLEKEKELTRLQDKLSAERRQQPWVKVEKNYVFDGPKGKETLADLFDAHSQLFVYHFMFGPDWEQGCPSCSMVADHLNGSIVHLAHRDVTLLAVSRAPLLKIEAFKKRMGWRFKWVSSYENDFNGDYRVSFTKNEIARASITTSVRASSRARKPTGSACSTRTKPVASSTHIPVTHAVPNRCSAFTTISTSCRRAVTKTPCRFRWHGFATTTGTVMRTTHERSLLLRKGAAEGC